MQATVPEFDMVIFGGTGDLAMRKLLPALFHRHCAGVLPADGRIIATARNGYSREQYLEQVERQIDAFVPASRRSAEEWATFRQRLHYVAIDAGEAAGFTQLANLLGEQDERVRVFYLATAPSLFGPICDHLQQAGLVNRNSRVVLEKP